MWYALRGRKDSGFREKNETNFACTTKTMEMSVVATNEISDQSRRWLVDASQLRRRGDINAKECR